MSDGVNGPAEPPPGTVGARLAAARADQDLSLDDIATRTRIPRRHLEAMERNEGLGMPGTTYAIGFAKSYARAVGLDANEIARAMRAELGTGESGRGNTVDLDPADPSRVPPRMLAIVFVILAVLVAGGYALWRSGTFGDNADTRAQLAAGTDGASVTIPVGSIGGVSPAPAPTPAPAVDGQVALTAIEPAWIRVYEMNGATLFQGEMKIGQRYDVPATAIDPRIRTGRPQSLRVTMGETVVAPLGTPDRVVRDLSLKAASLNARPPAATAVASQATPLVPLVPSAAPRP